MARNLQVCVIAWTRRPWGLSLKRIWKKKATENIWNYLWKNNELVKRPLRCHFREEAVSQSSFVIANARQCMWQSKYYQWLTRLLRSLHSPVRFARGFGSPQRHYDKVSFAGMTNKVVVQSSLFTACFHDGVTIFQSCINRRNHLIWLHSSHSFPDILK